METIGSIVRKHRRENKLSQRAFAQLAGLSQTQIVRIEADCGSLSEGTMQKLTKVTGAITVRYTPFGSWIYTGDRNLG